MSEDKLHQAKKEQEAEQEYNIILQQTDGPRTMRISLKANNPDNLKICAGLTAGALLCPASTFSVDEDNVSRKLTGWAFFSCNAIFDGLQFTRPLAAQPQLCL